MNKSNELVSLWDAIVSLESIEDAENFFKDLCTPKEIRSMQERWLVCQHLRHCSYREIQRITRSSLTTISRVARFLENETYGGYRKMLDRFGKN